MLDKTLSCISVLACDIDKVILSVCLSLYHTLAGPDYGWRRPYALLNCWPLRLSPFAQLHRDIM